MGFFPLLLFTHFASFPLNVVFPEPWRPAIRITEGFILMLISDLSPPMRVTSSSWTILTIIWDGLTDFNTSWPSAIFLTLSVNCFAILKLTSASRRALLTSLRVSAIFISEILPCPFKILNDFSSLSLKFSNIYCIKLIYNYILSGISIPRSHIPEFSTSPVIFER